MTVHSESRPRSGHVLTAPDETTALSAETARHTPEDPALRVRSNEDLPKLFQLPVAVALKPGSKDELAVRFEVPEDVADPHRIAFESALVLYCKSIQYGYALLDCEQMFSIDMEPAEPPDAVDRAQGRCPPGPRKLIGADIPPAMI